MGEKKSSDLRDEKSTGWMNGFSPQYYRALPARRSNSGVVAEIISVRPKYDFPDPPASPVVYTYVYWIIHVLRADVLETIPPAACGSCKKRTVCLRFVRKRRRRRRDGPCLCKPERSSRVLSKFQFRLHRTILPCCLIRNGISSFIKLSSKLPIVIVVIFFSFIRVWEKYV